MIKMTECSACQGTGYGEFTRTYCDTGAEVTAEHTTEDTCATCYGDRQVPDLCSICGDEQEIGDPHTECIEEELANAVRDARALTYLADSDRIKTEEGWLSDVRVAQYSIIITGVTIVLLVATIILALTSG